MHQQIFAGVPIESFITYLVRPDAIRTRIQIYRNETGGVVGYCAVHLFERQLDGRTVGVIRAEAGLLPGYRGTSATLWFGGSEALRYKGLHPLRMTVLFATPVHPSSYHMLSKYLWRSYPYPGRKTPAWVQRLLEMLADRSGSEPADPDLQVSVITDDPFRAIISEAVIRRVDLVLIGAPGKHRYADRFMGDDGRVRDPFQRPSRSHGETRI